MRLSVSRSIRLPRLFRPDPTASVALVCAALALGCVTQSAHDDVVRERDRLSVSERSLSQRVVQLEASTQSLDEERVRLIEEMEDLREERGRLDRDVRGLRHTEETLRKALTVREEELSEVSRLQGTYQGLIDDLEAEVSAGQIQIHQLREGLVVNVSDEILFPSGSAQLNDVGRELLSKVAVRLVELPHDIEVQGHTDNVPIRGTLTKRYATNWELAAARATLVTRLFLDAGIPGERLRAVSFAQYQPIASNDSPEDRARNRRTEIRLHPRDAEAVESAHDSAAPSSDEVAPAP